MAYLLVPELRFRLEVRFASEASRSPETIFLTSTPFPPAPFEPAPPKPLAFPPPEGWRMSPKKLAPTAGKNAKKSSKSVETVQKTNKKKEKE